MPYEVEIDILGNYDVAASSGLKVERGDVSIVWREGLGGLLAYVTHCHCHTNQPKIRSYLVKIRRQKRFLEVFLEAGIIEGSTSLTWEEIPVVLSSSAEAILTSRRYEVREIFVKFDFGVNYGHCHCSHLLRSV